MISERKKGAPLKKIIQTLQPGTDHFSQDHVLLECGHTAFSNAIYRAHCWKCKEGKPKDR